MGRRCPRSLVDGVLDWLAERGFGDVSKSVSAAEESLIFSLPVELRRDLKAAELSRRALATSRLANAASPRCAAATPPRQVECRRQFGSAVSLVRTMPARRPLDVTVNTTGVKSATTSSASGGMTSAARKRSRRTSRRAVRADQHERHGEDPAQAVGHQHADHAVTLRPSRRRRQPSEPAIA